MKETYDQSSIALPPKRVLFVLPSLAGGGAERVMLTILRHLDRRRFEPHLALVEAAGPLWGEVPDDVPVHDLKARRALFCVPALVRLAWKLRPDVVLATLDYLNLVLISARRLLPVTIRLLVRESASVTPRLELDAKHPKIWKWLYRHLYRKADKIICQSEHMLNDLAENFRVPLEKMVCIYNPIDAERVRRLAEHGNPYTVEGPHMVAAGRLVYQKGFDLLLDAMAMVLTKVPNAQLTILGSGPLERELTRQRDRIGLADAVRFVGFQTNPYPYLRHADLFVLSSRYEGLPNIVLESLALGTPVVAAKCPGGLEEVAEVDSRLQLVEFSSPRELAEKVLLALSKGRRQNAGGDHSRFFETFAAPVVLSRYESLFDMVTSGC